MEANLSMLRLKTRVEPTFSAQALSYLQNTQPTVVVKARIEENGSVTVLDATGANILVNNAVRSAVEMWKFTPALDENGTRCVDTEIPIGISRR
jgi:outer membrane biosynthesis protein TonB